MANGAPQSFDIFSLLGSLMEAAKDITYLTWFQRIQIALTTAATGFGTYSLSHGDITYTVLASLATFAMHTTAMYQQSPTDAKDEAAANAIGTALQHIEAAGDTAIKEAQKDPAPSVKSTLDDFIESEEKK